MVNLNELKLLLGLNGNQRIPYLEAEIFADQQCTMLYLRTLTCERLKGKNSVMDWTSLFTITYAISAYATNVMNERWLVAEPVMCHSEHRYRLYCEYFRIDPDILM